jgi:hypothetical protein
MRRFRRYAGALAIGCMAAGPAGAAPSEPLQPLDPRVLLQGVVTEEQVAAVFDYLRNAIIAAVEGREGPVPDFLRRELEKIDADIKLRGTVAGLLLLKELEAEVKKLLRAPEPAAPRPPIHSPSIRT